MAKAKKTDKTEEVDIIAEIEKRFGAGSLVSMTTKGSGGYDIIPTGVARLDRALGTGGWVRGRIHEIFGPQSGGKSTLCLSAISNAQKLGLRVAYVDAEHALDLSWAETIGVDTDTMMVAQPDFGEQALDIACALAESGKFGLVVVDSVAALTPKAELEGEMTDNHVGRQARMMGMAMRKLTAVASRTKTCMLFVNQIREKVGVMFGSPETTPAGKALLFAASIRVRVSGKKFQEGDTVVGTETTVKVVKNKMAPPFKEASFTINFENGIDRAHDLLDDAVEHGVIEKAGASFTYAPRDLKWHGRPNTLEVLRYDDELFAEVLGLVRTSLDKADQVVREAKEAKRAKILAKSGTAMADAGEEGEE